MVTFLLAGTAISLLTGQLRGALVLVTSSEQALRRKTELLELSHDAIIVADGSGVITGWNGGAVTLYGWKESEAVGQVIDQLLETESNPETSQMKDVLSRKGRWDGELRHTRSDGTRVLVESCQVLVHGPMGGPAGILEINRDITRRKQAEESLQRSEQATRALIESASQGIVGVDSEGHMVIVNAMTERLFGYRREELLGQPFELLVPANPRTRPMALAVESQARRKDGSQFAVEISLGTAETAHGRLSVNFITDITARSQAEAALVEASEHRRMALQAGGLGAWDYRFESGEILWDERCRDMFGTAAGSETTYEKALACVHREDRRTVDRAMDQALHRVRDGAYHEEFRVVWPDGSVHWIASHGQVYFEGEGSQRRAARFVGVNFDITERKRVQADILRLNSELEQRVLDRTGQLEASNRELEAFAYSVSHDLRAPLRGINGWSQALEEEYGSRLDQPGRGYLDRVRSETRRMGLLIDDLLKLSRVTRAEMQIEPVDLTSLAHHIAVRLQEAEPARRMEFVIQSGLAASGDPRLLEVVLTNLLSNAVKFTGPRPQARIEFGQERSGGELIFHVRDNGVGFNMVYAGTLFGAFQRLHKPSEFPGTGIGLATVQRVVVRHGGRAWAHAQQDKGATFFFTLGGRRNA